MTKLGVLSAIVLITEIVLARKSSEDKFTGHLHLISWPIHLHHGFVMHMIADLMKAPRYRGISYLFQKYRAL